MKLLAVVGSPRLKGNTNYLADLALAEAARKGAETEKIVLSRYDVRPCLGHDNCASFASCRQKDDMGWILDKFCQADGVILATPVYYWNVSAQMKTFMDRNFFLYGKDKKAAAKVVGVIVVAGGEGIDDTVHTLGHFINGSFNVAENRRMIISGCAGGAGEVKDNHSFLEEARQLGRDMVEVLKKDESID